MVFMAEPGISSLRVTQMPILDHTATSFSMAGPSAEALSRPHKIVAMKDLFVCVGDASVGDSPPISDKNLTRATTTGVFTNSLTISALVSGSSP
jgi:hypothetical protein